MRLRTAAVFGSLLALLALAPFARETAPPADPLGVALTPIGDGAAGDAARTAGDDVARLQAKLRVPGADPRLLERLGWSFVARARAEEDPGYYRLAENAALALEQRVPGDGGARLLRAHALVSLHRFAEAEAIARPLAHARGLPADFGLLGDALLSQGRLDEAADAYQRMMDLRPDAHAYARAAELRWLTGDAEGAAEAMRVAARAVSPRSREGFAWVFAQLALYELRGGAFGDAERALAEALDVDPDSAIAWRVRGRLLLAQDRPAEAADALARSAARSPLPETLWSLAEALTAAGRAAEARDAEARLVASGEGIDPRGLALYLASRAEGDDLPRARALLERELASRRDAVTLGALALVLAQSGDAARAWQSMQQALAPGTADARLELQAARVAAAAGRSDDARRWLGAAAAHRALLLPSERRALAQALATSV